ncbi:NAD(P)/FAD-dependent oxidoreductase [Qipengyuania sediminis]|uniref:NAD(P)/FAD-dependent oxidoreductase n=1 Tax=Qipengyuania sediminis TaxID=1532023 RepID=UPI00105A18B5|nr:FAD-dependent oxidoreductase [Qipengyuania sediminis]
MSAYDFAVVGAGIAGASIAAELAGQATVLLLETEDRPGYHATGRSAAFWEQCYGGPGIVPLTLASGEYLQAQGVLRRRGALYVGRADQAELLHAFMTRFAPTGAGIERLGREALAAIVPGIKPAWIGAVWEPECADIDVAALHQHYLSRARMRGVTLVVRARVAGLIPDRGLWRIHCADGRGYAAATVVNAAGAWADEVAGLAGLAPLGIRPLRRTVVQLRTDPAPPRDLPLVLDIAGGFYFKPEGDRLWLSPHDEVPSDPCDAAPEELAVAEAIDRLTAVVPWRVEAVERRWAGLRSFAPDRLPVYGRDPRLPAFAWFAGQGGYGIQTAPAAARLAAQALLGLERDAMTAALDAMRYAPDRLLV